MSYDKQTKLGVFYAVFAFVFWGIVPVYFKLLQQVPSFEVLMHRVIWSVVFLFFILWKKNEFKKLFIIFKNKKLCFYLFVSSVVIAINWLTFIWAIQNNQILQTSLGYYINPLVTILFGFIFLKEVPTKAQSVAIFLAFLAVVYQIYSLGYFPMVSILLAVTFPIYGLLKKKINQNSLIGLFIETLFLMPIALIYLGFLHVSEQNHFNTSTALLLMLAGIVTIIPLLAFNSATTRLKLSTVGYIQYIGPSVSLLLAIFVYDESISYEKIITFSLIWLALLIISIQSLKGSKK